MKAHTHYLTFNTRQRREIVRITDEVAQAVQASGVREGLCLVSASPTQSIPAFLLSVSRN